MKASNFDDKLDRITVSVKNGRPVLIEALVDHLRNMAYLAEACFDRNTKTFRIVPESPSGTFFFYYVCISLKDNNSMR